MKKNGSNLSPKLLEKESAPASNWITTSHNFSTTRGGPDDQILKKKFNCMDYLMRQGLEPRTKGHVYKNTVRFEVTISLWWVKQTSTIHTNLSKLEQGAKEWSIVPTQQNTWYVARQMF